jgi:hypothetical protein
MLTKTKIKEWILANRIGRNIYSSFQSHRFDNDYRARRERYIDLLQTESEAYCQEVLIARAKAKIKLRGYTSKEKACGEVHTFAYIPGNWPHQDQIAKSLNLIGTCTRLNYIKEGYTLEQLKAPTTGRYRRNELMDLLIERIAAVHKENPIDWFFSYAVGWDITSDAIIEIQEKFGIPTVNLSLDDRNWWEEIERGDAESGLINIAAAYDLGWTSAKVALPWYWAEGGQAIYLPEGADTNWFRPIDIEQDIDVGFVGSKFGYRPDIIENLRKAGLKVEVRGAGWCSGMIGDEEMLRFFNRTKINIGIGDMSYSRWLTNLKGRDFEIPATGRGLYLTTYNADLANEFHLGKEISCYRGIDEMIELIRYFLRNPDEVRNMASRARATCVTKHQWQHRFETIVRLLGIVN